MKYFELKKEIEELIEANRTQSSIVKANESALRRNLLEVRRAMGEVKLLLDKKASLEESLKELAKKIDNQLKPDFDKIYDSKSLNIAKKLAQLAPISEEINNCIKKGNLIIRELENLKEEFVEKEINKKDNELSPLWKEIKNIYDVDDFKTEFEIEIFDSIAEIDDYQKQNNEKLIEEVKKEIKESEKKKCFFGIFNS